MSSKQVVQVIEKLKSWQVLVVLALVAGVIFWQGLNGEMVLDDGQQIIHNRLIHSLEHIPRLFIGSTFYSGRNIRLEGLYYRPLMLTSFAVIYDQFGLDVKPYHLLQLVLHVANSFLVFVLLKRFFRKVTSFFGALVFLVHPINVEAVVYISNLQDVLFGFFGLLSSWVLILKPSRLSRVAAVSLASYATALLAKEVAVVYFVANSAWLWVEKAAVRMRYVLVGGIITAGYIGLRIMAVGLPATDRVIPIAAASFAERLMTLPKIYWYYIQLVLFPNQMAVGQNWVVRQVSFEKVVLPLLGVLVILGSLGYGLFRAYKSKPEWKPALAFFGGLFVTTALIHSQFFPLDVTVADRWFYSASIGLVGLLAILVDTFIAKIRWWHLGLIGMIVVLLAGRSFVRVSDWKTAFSLYSHDYEFVEDSFTLENNLGLEYLIRGDLEKALFHLERSTELSPEWGVSQNNLGLAYEMSFDVSSSSADLEKSIAAYKKAIENPTGVPPFANLGRVFLEKQPGNEETDLIFFNNSLLIFPEEPDLWYMKSATELAMGNGQAALLSARELYRLAPSRQSQWWLNQVLLMVGSQ